MQKIIAAAAVAACLVPALALAARPAKDSSFAWCTKKNVCPMTFDTNQRSRKLINFSLYSRCSPVPAMEGWPNIRVNRKGKFVRKKKAVGTFDVDRADCSDREREFVAKRRGPAS